MNLFVASLAFMYIIKFIKTLKYKSLKECHHNDYTLLHNVIIMTYVITDVIIKFRKHYSVLFIILF